ncbi:hypothetical protein HaLaN_01564 [Haematococcus lacustris]|uniref:Uncharacterized protein n=1 Tax=Haematococcus lacustris TaxID=44745 RepID=A0A699YIN1_HAELA|nr:hypothetical protein HaLaN_01564 [Haematococcus lacustris]
MPDSTYTVNGGSIGDDDDQCRSDNDFEIPQFNPTQARLAAATLDGSPEYNVAGQPNTAFPAVAEARLADADCVVAQPKPAIADCSGRLSGGLQVSYRSLLQL